MSGWNFADVWETVAATVPDRAAVLHGERITTWGDFDRRADGIADALLRAGAVRQDKVALYLHNRPEYLESVFACAKASLVPVNTNYRYLEDELLYLWDNADAVAVVFEGSFVDRVDAVRPRAPGVRTWLWVDDGSGPCPPWAVPYEVAAESSPGRVRAEWGRDGNDIFMIYTGGTTGIPKGVMWRQDDLYRSIKTRDELDIPDLERLAQRLGATSPPIGLPACPLMHGTGFLVALNQLNQGGCVVTLTSRSFDPVELLDAVDRREVTVLAIVGDASCRPILAALDDQPGRWDLASVKLVMSSGVMWSDHSKQRLLVHAPKAVLADMLGSTEAPGMGVSVVSSGGGAATASFTLGDRAMVIDEHDQPIEPGSGEVGRLAVRAFMPIGYYKDPDKSAATFRVIDGVRWTVPGDFAAIEADGTLRLVGRGSVCVNTGGEKVFPEEVEEALKSHEHVVDAVVIGVPDDRLVEAVCALVELEPGHDVAPADLISFAKGRIAAYKAPRQVVLVDSVLRAPNGKVDYPTARRRAAEALGMDVAGADAPV